MANELLKEQQRRAAINNAEDATIEKHFRSHQDLPYGRNFRCWNHTPSPGEAQRYRDNFDRIFRQSEA